MKLFYTPRSHFSRKVRILLAAFNLKIDLRDVGDVSAMECEAFGANPLMKVPTLIDGDQVVFDSDHIAQYLVHHHDPNDRFQVLTTDGFQLNARAIMNGVMAAEVELILAERTGIDTHAYVRFNKIRTSIHHGLSWLESRAELFPGHPTYLGFHLVALWDHLQLYDLISLPFANLGQNVQHLSAIDYVAESSPL